MPSFRDFKNKNLKSDVWYRCDVIFGICGTEWPVEKELQILRLKNDLFPDLEWNLYKTKKLMLIYASCIDAKYEAASQTMDGIFFRVSKNNTGDNQINTFKGAYSAISVYSNGNIELNRDRAGAYKIFYHQAKNHVEFSSNMLFFNKRGFSICHRALASFFRYLYISAPLTVYEDVKSIEPNKNIILNPKKIVKQLYSQNHRGLIKRAELSDDRIDTKLNEFEGLLATSIQNRLKFSHHPILLLSGGKDSSSIALAAKHSGIQNLCAITIGFDIDSIDESELSVFLCKHLQIKHEVIKPKPSEYVNFWKAYIQNMGQPWGDPAGLPLFIAFRLFSGKANLFLDGTGNDSYFGIPTSKMEEVIWNINKTAPNFLRNRIGNLTKNKSKTLDYFITKMKRGKEEQFISWRGWDPKQIRKIFKASKVYDSSPFKRTYMNSSNARELKTNTLCGIWEPEAAYQKTIQSATSSQISMAFPFRDIDLENFIRGLSQKDRIHNRTNKMIVRSYMKKYLPPEIVNKPKGSFIFPKAIILRSNRHELLRELLSKADEIAKFEGLDFKPIKKIVLRYIFGDDSLEDRVWAIAIFIEWYKFDKEKI